MLYTGIDGGGSKTEAVVCDESCRVLRRALTGATNPNTTPPELLLERLRALSPEREGFLFAGIAGALNRTDLLTDLLREAVGSAVVCRVDSDAVSMLSAGLLHADGCGIICGTGSVCFVRRNGALHRIGGWGYLLDGGGSGFDIGREGLSAALREQDGRGRPTRISQLIRRETGKSAAENLSLYYSEGSRDRIAACAPWVFEAARAGDAIAQDIIARNMAHLGEYLTCAARDFDGAFPVTLNGGILTHHPEALDALRQYAPPAAQLTLCPIAPVFGSIVEARLLNGLRTDDADARRFAESYRAVCNEAS